MVRLLIERQHFYVILRFTFLRNENADIGSGFLKKLHIAKVQNLAQTRFCQEITEWLAIRHQHPFIGHNERLHTAIF